jgi:hypothetical protein
VILFHRVAQFPNGTPDVAHGTVTYFSEYISTRAVGFNKTDQGGALWLKLKSLEHAKWSELSHTSD